MNGQLRSLVLSENRLQTLKLTLGPGEILRRGTRVLIKQDSVELLKGEKADIPWDQVKMATAEDLVAHVKNPNGQPFLGCIRLRVKYIRRSTKRDSEWRAFQCEMLDIDGEKVESMLTDRKAMISVKLLGGVPSDVDKIDVDDEFVFFAFMIEHEPETVVPNGKHPLSILCRTGYLAGARSQYYHNNYFYVQPPKIDFGVVEL